MQWMKEQAELRSGVKHDEAQNVSELYEKIGQEKFYELSRRFYDRGMFCYACRNYILAQAHGC
jgi:hypothetical protein